MFCSPQATRKRTGPSVILENTSQKMFIGNYKISETVNDSVVILVNFSDDMCKVNSRFSSSSSSRSEEQTFSS
jgi:hypothetical protein